MECMIRVGICEDEAPDRKRIEVFCEEFFRRKGIPCKIRTTGDAKETMKIIEEIDLLILDIELPGMDGITLKNRIQGNSKCMILFVTNHDEMMPDAFGVNVLGFVEKRKLFEKLKRHLNVAINMIGRDVVICGKYHSRDVMMIHSEREYCRLYFEDEFTTLIRSSLKKMEQELGQADFVRIDRARMIHLKYLERLGKREVQIAGERFSVSRGCWGSVNEAYEKYCERNARYS